MSNWRPEGWLDAIVKIYMDEDEDEIAWNERQFMEAGADAMLEALRKMGEHYNSSVTGVKVEKNNLKIFTDRKPFTTVHIPDDTP